MRIFRIGISKALDRQALAEAAGVLKRGGTVVYPTETAYGLGCDATDRKAVQKIFKIKGRDRSKPLPLIVASSGMARRYARFDPRSSALARRFWPGPLTLVLPPARTLAPGVAGPEGESAMRVSPHPIARGLASRLGRPLVATSANRSGGETRYRAADVIGDLGTLPDLVLDAGPLKKTDPSTIVRCDECCCEILRIGPIGISALRDALRSC